MRVDMEKVYIAFTKQDLTVNQFAAKCGVSAATLQRHRYGRTKRIAPIKANQIAKALGLELEDILIKDQGEVKANDN